MLCEDDILLLIIIKNISRSIFFFGGFFTFNSFFNASLREKEKNKNKR